MTTPAAFGESSNIYFGAVAPGAKSEVNFTIEDYEFARYDSSDMDTFQPWYYAMDAQYTFTATTDMYNDTSLPSGAGTVRNTPFNITAELGSETWMTAEYAFISVAVPAAASVSSIRLYDWGDTDADGTMTFYNATSKTGDYIQYRGRDSNGDTVYWIKIADPAGIDNLFANSPALIVFDSAATLTTGNAVDVTITTFEKIADADVLVNPYTSGATATNITLVVPSDADYGIHQGFISVVDGGFMHEVPYSYMVEFTLDTTDSTPKTVIDTFGDELTPYESGA
ncbi:MAG: hypothetical protein ACW99J_12075, partial [Candidatus Thorarchaeota archaeon]